MRLTGPILVLLCLCCGCRTTPAPTEFFDQSEFTRTYESRVASELKAPIIVVGQVESAHPTATFKTLNINGDIRIQLTQVVIRVEQLLRGPVGHDRLTFSYYQYARQNDRELGIAHNCRLQGSGVYFS